MTQPERHLQVVTSDFQPEAQRFVQSQTAQPLHAVQSLREDTFPSLHMVTDKRLPPMPQEAFVPYQGIRKRLGTWLTEKLRNQAAKEQAVAKQLGAIGVTRMVGGGYSRDTAKTKPRKAN